MPRLTDDDRELRRREILVAAARCFAEGGFHATSMHDVFSASGLTAGLVYRYFESKDQLIVAVAQDALHHVQHCFVEAAADRPAQRIQDAMGMLMQAADHPATEQQMVRVIVQVWAEALRNPAVAPIAARAQQASLEALVELIRRAQAAGSIDRLTDAANTARSLYSLVAGFVLQRALDQAVDRAAYELAARGLLEGRLHQGAVTAAPATARPGTNPRQPAYRVVAPGLPPTRG